MTVQNCTISCVAQCVYPVNGLSSIEEFNQNSFRANAPIAALSITTYDGGNELVHPSVWFDPLVWNGYQYWMAATPFYESNNQLENPSIYASNDGDTWVVPTGLTNPIESAPSGGYNSDAHLVHGNDGYLYCFWRQRQTTEKIYYKRSSDGVTWGDKTLILENDPITASYASPTVLWDGVNWRMYVVEFSQTPKKIYYFTSTTLNGTWTLQGECTVTLPDGREPWHLDVKLFRGVYTLLLMDCVSGTSGSTGELYLCFSNTGINFDRSTFPVIPSISSWYSDIYRSSILPKMVAGKVAYDLFLSASIPAWLIGRTTISSFDLIDYENQINLALQKIAPYLGGDDFNRSNGAIGVSASGHEWTASSGSPVIIDNQIGSETYTNNIATIIPAESDLYFEAAMYSSSALTQEWLVFRFTNSLNFMRVGFNAGGFRIQKIESGGTTTYFDKSSIPPSVIPGCRIGVNITGDSISAYINGSKIYTFSNSFQNTVKKIGIQFAETTVRIDNFFWRTSVE